MPKVILVEVAHPKHVLQFLPLVKKLKSKGYMITVLARPKSVVKKLLSSCVFDVIYLEHKRDSIVSRLRELPSTMRDYFKIVRKLDCGLIISRSSPFATLTGRILGIPSIIFPDSEVVSLTRYVSAPLASKIVTPLPFTLDYGAKHIRMDGMFEEVYLHPSVFQPDPEALTRNGLGKEQGFAFLRFVEWKANHDKGQWGFSTQEKRKLISHLVDIGKQVILSDEDVDTIQNDNVLSVKEPQDVHSLMSLADVYVGDSQSMATEASLLGTSSIRYNSFVGPNDMGNFIYLEKQGILHNVKSLEGVIEKLNTVLSEVYQNSCRQWRSEYFESRPYILEPMEEICLKEISQ